MSGRAPASFHRRHSSTRIIKVLSHMKNKSVWTRSLKCTTSVALTGGLCSARSHWLHSLQMCKMSLAMATTSSVWPATCRSRCSSGGGACQNLMCKPTISRFFSLRLTESLASRWWICLKSKSGGTVLSRSMSRSLSGCSMSSGVCFPRSRRRGVDGASGGAGVDASSSSLSSAGASIGAGAGASGAGVGGTGFHETPPGGAPPRSRRQPRP